VQSPLARGRDGTGLGPSEIDHRERNSATAVLPDARIRVLCRGVPPSRGGAMFDFRDLFQWERFITPSIIKIFYWLAVGVSVLIGLSGIFSGLLYMAVNPFAGLMWILSSLIGVLMGVIFSRIVAEFVLITFRINEHLGAIRNRGQM
jgi:hypothetical protein